MTLPIENYLAAFPPVRTGRMGWLRRPVVLGPLTLGKCVLIDALGVDPCRTVAEKDAALVAYVLSQPSQPINLSTSQRAFKRFVRRVKRNLKPLSEAVNETMKDAFTTYVKPQPDKGPAKTTPSGIGWWLSYAEALCEDYGWTWHQVLDTPLATVFALTVAQRERYCIDNGDSDYIERAYIKEHFRNG